MHREFEDHDAMSSSMPSVISVAESLWLRPKAALGPDEDMFVEEVGLSMRRRELCLTAMVVMSGMVCSVRMAQAQPQTLSKVSVRGPSIEMAEKDFDFGQVVEGSTVDHIYRFRNVGDALLEIQQVHASCGCTAVVVSEEHRKLAPGQEGEVKATFNSQGRSGAQHKIITVQTNDPQHQQTQLSFKGDVVLVLKVQPEGLSFGDVMRGTSSQPQTITVSAVDKQPFAIQSVRQASDHLAIHWEQTADGSSVVQVSVIAKDTDEPVRFTEKINILSNHPRKPDAPVTVTWQVVGEIAAIPAQLVLARPEGKASAETSFSVARRIGGEFVIQQVTGVPDYMESTLEAVMPGRQYTVHLKLKGSVPASASRVQLRVLTDDPRNTRIPVDVTILPGPSTPVQAQE